MTHLQRTFGLPYDSEAPMSSAYSMPRRLGTMMVQSRYRAGAGEVDGMGGGDQVVSCQRLSVVYLWNFPASVNPTAIGIYGLDAL